MAGYLDAQTRHDANWQIGKIKSVVIVFLFWVTVYYVWEPYQRGYLIQPWFIFALIVIYTFHPLIAWLSQRRGLFFAVLLTLLCCSYGYDLLSVIYPDRHLFSLPPQYRLWTWLLFYLTGQLFNDPKVAEWIRNPQVIKGSIIALPFVYLFTWFYERHFFFALFKEAVLATVSKAMTGVYILHYSVFHLLVMLIPVHSLATKLGVIALTFVLSVLISLAALSSTLLRKVITL